MGNAEYMGNFKRDMRLTSALLWTLAVATQKCTFDECLACTIVDANANYYPSFKRMCGVISPCCRMQYMEPLKQSIGEFTKLAEKKLTETMFQLLQEKTLNIEISMKNMKSTPMILVSMDADDNTDIIFNRPSQKIPIEKKHPTYINAVMPPIEIDDEYQLKNKVFGEKIMVTP